MMDASMVPCPRCGGKKALFGFINRGEDISTHSSGFMKCSTCDGSGEVSVKHMAAIIHGGELRKERMRRGESLYEAAIRQGTTPARLSAIEHGRE